MSSETPTTSLTERDLLPVKELIDEVRAQERAERLLAATVTWLNAFTQFKRARRRYGLPRSNSARYCYGTVVGDLKTTGKALLVCLDNDLYSLQDAPIDKENLAACVRELCCDDVILDIGLLTADLSHVEAVLGKV